MKHKKIISQLKLQYVQRTSRLICTKIARVTPFKKFCISKMSSKQKALSQYGLQLPIPLIAPSKLLTNQVTAPRKIRSYSSIIINVALSYAQEACCLCWQHCVMDFYTLILHAITKRLLRLLK